MLGTDVVVIVGSVPRTVVEALDVSVLLAAAAAAAAAVLEAAPAVWAGRPANLAPALINAFAAALETLKLAVRSTGDLLRRFLGAFFDVACFSPAFSNFASSRYFRAVSGLIIVVGRASSAAWYGDSDTEG